MTDTAILIYYLDILRNGQQMSLRENLDQIILIIVITKLVWFVKKTVENQLFY